MRVEYNHPVSNQTYVISTEGHGFSISRGDQVVFGDGKVVGLSDATLDEEQVVKVAKMWVDAQIG